MSASPVTEGITPRAAGGAVEHPPHAPSDYTRWRGLAGTWSSIDEFVSAEVHTAGAHHVDDEEGPLDVYLIGDPLHDQEQAGLPVFFTGAITNRENGPGPYFSGLTIAREAGVSALAVSDRTITRHRDLALAWYEGCGEDRTAPQLARFLREVHLRSGKRLVLTGGSGGGFAALQMERRLTGIATAFCWNPQTDLLRYTERTTRQYLSSCFPEVPLTSGPIADSHDHLRSVLAEQGVATDCWTTDLPRSQSVLYLQNAGDWHVEAHAMPFATGTGLTQTDQATFGRKGVVMMVGSWGEGHSTPPRELLEGAIRALASTPDPERVADHLMRVHPQMLTGPGAAAETSAAVSPGRSARPVQVFVYGSCVARDTLEYLDGAAFALSGYVARQSLISAMHPADPALVRDADLESRFQRRMLEGDARSNLWDLLSEAARGTDLVLCDLTDERLGVFELPDGSFLTRSVELIRSGLEPDIARQSRWIPFGSDEHFSLWRTGLELFSERMADIGLRDRVLFLLVPWATLDTMGMDVAPSFGTDPQDANASFARYDQVVAAVFAGQTISMAAESVRTDTHHRWGPAPFHYARATYETIAQGVIERVAERTRSGLVPVEEPVHPPVDVQPPRVEAVDAPSSVGPTIEQHAPRSLTVESGTRAPIRVAYHLYRGTEKVAEIGYSERRSAQFDDLPRGSYSCRVFSLDPVSGVRSAATTSRIEVETLPTGPAILALPRMKVAVAGRHSTAVLLALVLSHHHDLVGLVAEPSFLPQLVCGIPVVTSETLPAGATLLDVSEPARSTADPSGLSEWQQVLERELTRLSAMQMYRIARRLHLAGAEREARFLKTRIYQDFGCILPYTAHIGEGTRLGYGGIATVIHSRASIGARCVISQNVTIGARTAPPHIGDDVFIGAGSTILAPEIGSGAVIGANSVVLTSVPSGAVVAGNPARIISRGRQL